MRRVSSARPSPAIVIAILALVAGVTGAAVAQPSAKKAVTKKKVKKIATKQINKLAPGLSVANADTLQGKPASAFASKASEPFHEVGTSGEPGFQSGWTNIPGFSTAAFFKDPLGLVHLRGAIEDGGNGNTAFTLPAGYRPSKPLLLPAGGAGPIAANGVILPSGQVRPACTTGPVCSDGVGIDGLTFRVP